MGSKDDKESKPKAKPKPDDTQMRRVTESKTDKAKEGKKKSK